MVKKVKALNSQFNRSFLHESTARSTAIDIFTSSYGGSDIGSTILQKPPFVFACNSWHLHLRTDAIAGLGQ